jgi:predicted nucleic acid-binding protein
MAHCKMLDMLRFWFLHLARGYPEFVKLALVETWRASIFMKYALNEAKKLFPIMPNDVRLLTEGILFPDFPDPKDRYLLAMLRDGEADVLVTGDTLLLELKRFEEKPMISPAQFMALLKESERS